MTTKLIPTLLLLIVGNLSLRAQSESVPDRLEFLKSSYEAAVKRAIAPLTEKYISELQALHTELTKSGDLEGAKKIDQTLRKLKGEATLAEIVMGRAWKYEAGTQKSQLIFNEDGTVDVSTRPDIVWTWTIENDNVLFIKYGDATDNGAKFEFENFDELNVEGKTTNQGWVRLLSPMLESQ